MNKNSNPDPEENYLSKWLLSFNQKELDKFFHPEKFPKMALSAAALCLIIFLFIATTLPLKDKLMNSFYPKPDSNAQVPSQATIILDSARQVQLGSEIKVYLKLKTNQAVTLKSLQLDLSYPTYFLTAQRIEIKNNQLSWPQKEIHQSTGQVSLLSLSPESGFKPSSEEVLAVVIFKAIKSGEANIIFADSSILMNTSGEAIPTTKHGITISILNP